MCSVYYLINIILQEIKKSEFSLSAAISSISGYYNYNIFRSLIKSARVITLTYKIFCTVIQSLKDREYKIKELRSAVLILIKNSDLSLLIASLKLMLKVKAQFSIRLFEFC